MSEQRRATLKPIEKCDRKPKNSPRKTNRLSFTLSDPNENSCPVFDYAAAVKAEERKKLKKHREEIGKKPNGILDPFGDDDEDVRQLARKFEAKYGDRAKLKSYADLGAGYDETDPFIDNTDANDEALQEDQETACGGYYINSGPLELKRVEVSDHSDADEVKKRKSKGTLPVIEEEEEDEVEEEKDEAEEEGGDDVENMKVEESKPNHDEGLPEPKKIKLLEERFEPEKPPTPSYNGVSEDQPVKKRKKRVIEDDVDSVSKIKKAKTVKALLEEKRVQEQPVKSSEEPKRHVASEMSITEAIESVVNAGNARDHVVNDENSNSSTSSHSAATATSSATDDSQDAKPSDSPPPLPDNLLPEVVTLVEQIKCSAAITDNTRKTFHPDINNCLVKLEWKTRELSAAQRNMLFAHLAHQLPCTKDTLMKRAKKLFLDKEESQVDNFICKLKATIDASMPSLLERYQKECQKIADEKGLPAGESTLGEENQHSSSPNDVKHPKRKFPWTDETRSYLLSIVRCKARCFKICKPRKSTFEEYLKTFLHSTIRPLWPPGWMKTSALNKEVTRTPRIPLSRRTSFGFGYNPKNVMMKRFSRLTQDSKNVKSKSSSHHSPTKVDSPRPAPAPGTVPSSSPTNGSLSATPSGDTSLQTTKSTAVSTPLTAKTGADPINLLSKINSSFTSASQKKPSSYPSVKSEVPEFAMDCLLKRTSESSSCNDYNTTLSDLMKTEGLLVNGLSLPLKNVNKQNNKSDSVLDLSGCNSASASAIVTPSVIQSTSERTTLLSDNVSARVNSSEKLYNHTPPSSKEAMSHVPLNRKQRLLQSPESNRNCETYDVSVIKKTDCVRYQSQAAEQSKCGGSGDKPLTMERESDKETTTATDILNQIINESLRSPPQAPYTPVPAKVKEEVKSQGQELLFDVMQDLKELNHISGGSRDSKNTSFTGASWSYPVKSLDNSKSTPYHDAFLNYIQNPPNETLPISCTPPSPTPYSRHNTSPYDNSTFVNEVNKPLYSHSPHRTSQSLPTHASTPTNKASHMNQMKNLSNMGSSSGLPHRYMGQMDYNSDDPHLLGLPSSLPYSLTNWPYPGSESQSHQ